MRRSTGRIGLALFTVCLVYSQTVGTPLSFEAASIKPHSDAEEGGIALGGKQITSKGGVGAAPYRGGSLNFKPGSVVSGRTGVTARRIVLEAYSLTPYQLSGGPGWLDSDAFDLLAKAEANETQLRQMLRTLLAERFQLVVHRETKEMPVYALMVGKNGTKLRAWKQGDAVPMPAGNYTKNLRFVGTMQLLADDLSGNAAAVGRPVLDKTGLTGTYILSFGWEADEDYIPALQAQLGLKLESQKAALDTVVIDRIERPSSN